MMAAATRKRRGRADDGRSNDHLFDRELDHLPPEARWREWMHRVEATIFAASEPVGRETLARIVGKSCSIDLLIDDIREELRGRPYDLVAVAGGFRHLTRPAYADAIRTAVGAILVDEGYGTPTAECIDLAEIGDEGSIVEDVFHDGLRTALSRVGKNADSLYRAVRENIIRKPCRTRREVLAFASENPELASEIPSFFSPLPVSAPHGKARNDTTTVSKTSSMPTISAVASKR
jgi:hypothetical protein